MKRLFTFLIAAIAAITALQAQNQKKVNLLVDYFYTTGDVKKAYATEIRNVVADALNASNRVRIIDVETSPTLKLEEDRREVGVSAGDDMERLALMTQEGADLLLQGIVNSISIKENTSKNSDGTTTTLYEATISLTLKVIDPKTGTVTETTTITVPSGFIDISTLTILAHSADEAVSAYAKALIPKKLKKFINDAFPVEGKVLELAETKGKEVKTLYIDLGDNFGAKKKMKFDVREVRTVAGRTSRKVIGEVEIIDVEGEDISLCKVNKGGDKIKTAADAEIPLVVTSKD